MSAAKMDPIRAAVTRGIAIALVEMAEYGQPQQGSIEGVLSSAGIWTPRELRAANASERDIAILRPYMARAARGNARRTHPTEPPSVETGADRADEDEIEGDADTGWYVHSRSCEGACDYGCGGEWVCGNCGKEWNGDRWGHCRPAPSPEPESGSNPGKES